MLDEQGVVAGAAAEINEELRDRLIREVVGKGFVAMGEAYCKVGVLSQHAAPVGLQIAGGDASLALGVPRDEAVARSGILGGRAGAEFQRIHRIRMQIRPEVGQAHVVPAIRAIQEVGDFGVVVVAKNAGQTVVPAPAGGQAEVRRLITPAQLQQAVVHAPFAAALADMDAQRIERDASDDIDHAEERPRAEGGGIRAAQHLDALDILEGDRLQAVSRRADEKRRIHGAAIDQHLDAVGKIPETAVINRLRGTGFIRFGDLETRHQAHQGGDIARAAQADHVAVDDGDGAGRLVEGLRQARDREDDRHVAEIVLFRGRQRLPLGNCGKRPTKQGDDKKLHASSSMIQ